MSASGGPARAVRCDCERTDSAGDRSLTRERARAPGPRERLDVARGGSPFGSSVQTSGRYRGR